jgi:predicted nuclease of predicted toxin-antitoxin system
VRLLLDANLSPRRIGGPLRAAGHDVRALAEDAAFEGLDDPVVLELATEQQRVLVTRNCRDFAPLAREWAEAQRAHAGMILIWTLDHSQFGEIVAGVERLLGQWTQEQWRDLAVALLFSGDSPAGWLGGGLELSAAGWGWRPSPRTRNSAPRGSATVLSSD